MRRTKRKSCTAFNIDSRRRREIESYAQYVSAANTKEFWRWLVAWIWHYRGPNVTSRLIAAAMRMRYVLTEAEADRMVELAGSERRRKSADALARFLGLKYVVRQFLGITTIGSVDVNKKARKAMRKQQDRLYQESRRRDRGARSQAQSTAAQARKEGVSRMTMYRRQKAAKQANNSGHVTLSSAADSLNAVDRCVTSTGKACGHSASASVLNTDNWESIKYLAFSRREVDGLLAADGSECFAKHPKHPDTPQFDSLAVELRMMALCLPFEPVRLREAA
jgi:hypothetical protein